MTQRGGDECGLPGPWGLCGSGVIRGEGSGTVLGFGLRKEGSRFCPEPSCPSSRMLLGEGVDAGLHVQLLEADTTAFGFHGFGGNR